MPNTDVILDMGVGDRLGLGSRVRRFVSMKLAWLLVAFAPGFCQGAEPAAELERAESGWEWRSAQVQAHWGNPFRVQAGGTEVEIPDDGLRCAVTEALGKASDEAVTQDEMATLAELASSCEEAVEDLSGLEHASGLQILELPGNAISDLSVLSELVNLVLLDMSDNSIVDIEPLVGLTALRTLDLSGNAVADIEALAGLTALGTLFLSDNAIEDIEVLAGLTALGTLFLSGNAVEDIEALAGLTGLTVLDLADNAVVDIEPLAALASPLELNLKGNPLTAASIATHLQGFREAGATVHWNWEHEGRQVAWFVPSAADTVRQGFVRVINRSVDGGEASIVAIDDLGQRYGPITLTLDGNETVHFNSGDLEAGSPGKGLSAGTGPGDGDWRLQFDSELDLDVLSYMRTADGFLTALHDVATVEGAGHLVATFNPGSNLEQVSSLRISNPGSQDAEVTITGDDDDGVWSVVRVDVAAGESVSVTASELESGVGVNAALHDGAGKWRLRLDSTQPVVAMSLLSSPTGHLTNLSTLPSRVAGAYRVPLFPSSADESGRQGFVRVRNRSIRAGLVRVEAYDDSDTIAKAIVFLRIGAGETRHFNSQDLELGADSKGLIGSTGPSNAHLGAGGVERLGHRRAVVHPHHRRLPDVDARLRAEGRPGGRGGGVQPRQQPRPGEPAAVGQPGDGGRRGDDHRHRRAVRWR